MRAFAIVVVCLAALGLAGLLADLLMARWTSPGTVPTAAAIRADRIVVVKGERRLDLMAHGRPIKSYRIALGWSPVGHKRQEGDGRTPEGVYMIDWRNARSQFHLSLRISYPNGQDRSAARGLGVAPGGDIFIHGQPNGLGRFFIAHPDADWTDGCIAVTDAEIEEIWASVPDGTPIEIRP